MSCSAERGEVQPAPFELQLPPLGALQVHEVVNNELINKLRQAEVKLRQLQRCGIKSETQVAHSLAELKRLQLENGLLRLEHAALGGHAGGLAASLAAANATCQRQQDEVATLRAALHRANLLRIRAQQEADELRSKFEVALQVQVVCLKGEDQAKGQLDAALKELEKLKEERSFSEIDSVDALVRNFSSMEMQD